MPTNCSTVTEPDIIFNTVLMKYFKRIPETYKYYIISLKHMCLSIIIICCSKIGCHPHSLLLGDKIYEGINRIFISSLLIIQRNVSAMRFNRDKNVGKHDNFRINLVVYTPD